jgi:hypothetical protein
LNNAAAFEMGAGIKGDVTNITVRDSDVIRGEYNWPNTSDAVFSANQGGSGNLSNYTFDDIRVENETWQLMKIEILPSNFQRDNYQIWVNHATGQLGITRYLPFLKSPLAGQVFAILPADTEIQAIGDFNADGGKDLLLWNASTSENTIWYMNFDSGAFYQVGPTLQPSLAAGLQVVPN